ncbi:MAG: hypothetical protein ABEI53_02570 [Candidatus Magasanikbacteria bacterium]
MSSAQAKKSKAFHFLNEIGLFKGKEEEYRQKALVVLRIPYKVIQSFKKGLVPWTEYIPKKGVRDLLSNAIESPISNTDKSKYYLLVGKEGVTCEEIIAELSEESAKMIAGIREIGQEPL